MIGSWFERVGAWAVAGFIAGMCASSAGFWQCAVSRVPLWFAFGPAIWLFLLSGLLAAKPRRAKNV